jgi:peptide/nickel transport system substrate-binding protein
MHRKLGLLAAVGAMALLPWSAVAQEKVFRYATTGDILGLDPHVNIEGPTNTMKGNIYGCCTGCPTCRSSRTWRPNGSSATTA